MVHGVDGGRAVDVVVTTSGATATGGAIVALPGVEAAAGADAAAGRASEPAPVAALQPAASRKARARTASAGRRNRVAVMPTTVGAESPGASSVWPARQDGRVQPAEIVAALSPLLDGALVATDFDGTLAPLVADPDRSRPVAGTIDALTALARRGAQIAVITGRDAETVVRLGGLAAVPGILVAGVYGIETWAEGTLSSPSTPPEVEQLRVRLPAIVERGDPDVWIEDKRLSLVVHARRAADPVAALAALTEPVTALGAELGFDVHRGSDVLELRLPGHDKAGALTRLADGRPAALYLGDDLGDLPAFAELRRMRAAGVPAFSVGVRSSGVPELEGAADAYVDDPAAAVALLVDLAR